MTFIKIKQRLELWVTRAWYDGAVWLWLLWPLSALVRAVVYVRRKRFLAYPPADSETPVVVVGGITVGGTGKTPVIIALVDALTSRGLNVAVVSRGYGGTVIDPPEAVSAQTSADAVGDEPRLIALRCDCPVIVGRNRAAAVRYAERFGPDVILSDDGMQHYGMARAFEILVLDAARGLGNKHLLPMGPLREPATRLESVDWLLERDGEKAEHAFHYDISVLRHHQSGERITTLKAQEYWRESKAIAALTALGQPDQFFNSLESLGLTSVNCAFPDHYTLTKEDLDAITADIIIITEKDAVKIPSLADERLWVLVIDAVIPDSLVATLVTRFQSAREDACSEL